MSGIRDKKEGPGHEYETKERIVDVAVLLSTARSNRSREERLDVEMKWIRDSKL
jgi:hypothetical protein